jgi:spermidine/putrescine-binding protein
MALPTQSKATRRSFLKLAAAGAAGAAAGPWVSRHAQAKPVSITFARESSYVKNFDVHFQNVMAPAYEKATGIKIEYQIQAAGGSAVPQLVSMVENKAGADLAWVQQEWLYRDALVDVSDIAEEGANSRAAGTTRSSACPWTRASGSPCPTEILAS